MASSGSRASSSGRGTRQRRCIRATADASPENTLSAEQVIGNDDLLKQILIRLPAKPLFRFKLVCTRWRGLISDPELLRQWKMPRSASALYIRKYCAPSSSKIYFHYIPLTDIHMKAVKKVTRSFDFFPVLRGIKISDSCNGLLLCSTNSMWMDVGSNRYFVYNPVTKYFAFIPRPRSRGIGDDRVFLFSMNLAYDPSVSFHYKVLAVRSRTWQGKDCQIDIYSSEIRDWETPREPLRLDSGPIFQYSVFLNGKMHWPGFGMTSLYYDFSEEKLLPMTMPCRLHSKRQLCFKECGGHLQLIQVSKDCCPQFNVYEMEEDYSSWFVKYRVDLKVGFPEIRDFDVLCVVGGEVGGDSCLLVLTRDGIISYNFKDRSIRKVCDLKLRPGGYNIVEKYPWCTVHPFIETPFPVLR